jgi:hypothetical protein
MNWEYRVMSASMRYRGHDQNVDLLDQEAAAGWELVSAVLDGVNMYFYLRRPKS